MRSLSSLELSDSFGHVVSETTTDHVTKRNGDENAIRDKIGDFIILLTSYHNVTTSFEYVFVGTDFALARPIWRRKERMNYGTHDNEPSSDY